MAGALGLHFPKFVLLIRFFVIKKAPTALPEADKRKPISRVADTGFLFMQRSLNNYKSFLITANFPFVELFYTLTKKLNKAGQFFTPKI